MWRRGVLVVFVVAACSADPAEVRDVVEIQVPAQLAATSTASANLSVMSAAPTSTPIASSAPEPPVWPLPGLMPPGAFPPGLLPPGLMPPQPGGVSGVPQSTATSISPATAPGLGATLRTVVAANAAGMTPVGTIEAARFKQGEVLVVALQLSPMQCLTAIAVSDTMGELDLEIHLALPQGMGMPAMLLAKDPTIGPRAVLGGAPNCFKNALPMPMPMVLVVRAQQGNGTALVQVFAK